MAKILIKTGEFKGEAWVLQGQFLTNGFYKVKELPLTELKHLIKKQELNNLLYADFRFTNGINFTASMNSALYEELNEVIQCIKDDPENETYKHRDSSGDPLQADWEHGRIVAKHSQQNILMVFGLLIFSAIFTYGVMTADLNKRETMIYQHECIKSIIALTGYEKTKLIGDRQNIQYTNDADEQFTFRCTEDKVQFHAESTGQWVNMVP